MYQIWVQKVQGHFKFNPKTMNRLFRELDTAHTDKHSNIIDYNRLVTDFFRQNDNNTFERQVSHSEEAQNHPPQYINSGFNYLPMEE
jgi:hypothetical protein